MPPDISQLIETGLEHHQSGRFQEAEAIYQTILKQQPQHPDALHLLGVIALQVGKNEIAVKLIEKAIKENPDEPDFYNNCGEAYRALRKTESAIARYEQAIAIKPDFAGPHNNLGNAFKELGQVVEAISRYEQAIAVAPDFFMAHNNKGIALKELGKPEDAITCYEQALAIMPNYAEAHNNMGNALLVLGRAEDAITHFEQAIAIIPGYAEAHSNLGNALKESGRPKDAISCYEQALAINPDFAMAHYNLGIALDELGRPNDAATRYEKALAIQPEYAEAHNNLGNALDELGRQEDAITHYEQAIAIKPDYAEAHRNLTTIKPKQEQVSILEKLLERPSLSEADAIHCHFALGNIYRDVETFNKAFEHYNKGNALKRKAIIYDSQNYSAYVDRLIKAYSKAYFQEITTYGSDSELPVFIVGMPRSGTTLVEQIVSNHPQVYGAGELSSLIHIEDAITRQLEASNPYPECMPLCNGSIKLNFANSYLEELGNYSHDAKRITDKMPGNFIRIGLIKTLFPKARIIHCQRNALDTCTSNFLNYFAIGNEYSFDLNELGQYYLDYERLMVHWTKLFPIDILAVQYEELVMNQEKISRQIIGHIGLEWDNRCLEFHLNKRAVNTFSSMQVRLPVYTHSINRWKQFEEHLAPLMAILQRTSSD